MPTDRPDRLFFAGEYDAQGRPLEFFAAVPARDLDEADIAALTDGQLADITGAPEGRRPLYQKTKPANRDEDSPAAQPAEAPAEEPSEQPRRRAKE
jgi:hypothetical protein